MVEAKDVQTALLALLGDSSPDWWDQAMGPSDEPVTWGDHPDDENSLVMRFGDVEFLVTVKKI